MKSMPASYIGLAKIVFLSIACLLWPGCQNVSIPTPTSSSMPTVTVPTSTSVPAPSWHGITPGVTTRSEVLRIMGEPSIVKTYGDLESLRYYNGGLMFSHDKVILRDGIVQTLLVRVKDSSDYPNINYGNVAKVLGYEEYPALDAVYLYPANGIAILSAPGKAPNYVQYFVPMSLDDYMSSWGKYHPTEDPFPIRFPGRPDKLDLLPGKSTKQQVIGLYGQPDYVDREPLPWDENTLLESYYYHIPRKSLADGHAFGFVSDILTIMRVELDGEGYTLGQVIDEYGVPEIVFQKRGYFGLYSRSYIFPRQGVLVLTPDLSSEYEAPKRSHTVTSKLCFASMSLEQYLSTWAKSFLDEGWKRIEWKGLIDE